MSMDSATKFWNEMQKDAEMLAKVDGMVLETIRSMAAEKGFECTTDELKAAREKADELSAEELAAVAGGGGAMSSGPTTGNTPIFDPSLPNSAEINTNTQAPNPNSGTRGTSNTGL